MIGQVLRDILFSGDDKSYNPDKKYVQIAAMFNYIVNNDGKIIIDGHIDMAHLMAKWKKRKETDDNTIILCIIVAKLCALWVV